VIAGADLLRAVVTVAGELILSTTTGVLLADAGDRLEIAATSDDTATVLELLQAGVGEGPCVDSYRRGDVVSVDDIRDEAEWPVFRDAAVAQGVLAVHSVPLRLREATVGSMNLFRSTAGAWTDADTSAAQALADLATIGILQSREVDRAHERSEQLQHALDSRVLIEQAKGFVAVRRDMSPAEAFDVIRAHARQSRQPLGEVAEQIVSRRLEL
jgi:GAF domain-containing protein